MVVICHANTLAVEAEVMSQLNFSRDIMEAVIPIRKKQHTRSREARREVRLAEVCVIDYF
jgi:hypothetical protein